MLLPVLIANEQLWQLRQLPKLEPGPVQPLLHATWRLLPRVPQLLLVTWLLQVGLHHQRACALFLRSQQFSLILP